MATSTLEERLGTRETLFPNGRNLFVNKFELTPTGIIRHGQPSYEEWDALGCWLRAVEKSVQWWIGSWVNLGEDLFHERAAQAVDATGWQTETVLQYSWVERKVAPAQRRSDLTFSHHREVADLAPSDQSRWLSGAVEGDSGSKWSVDKLRRELSAEKTGERKYWLLVQCNGQADLDTMTERLIREGRVVKVHG